MLGSALLAELGTPIRLEQALQNVAGAAFLRLHHRLTIHGEAAFGIIVGKFIAQAVAAGRDDADPSPGPVADLKDLLYKILASPCPYQIRQESLYPPYFRASPRTCLHSAADPWATYCRIPRQILR